jgi:branched-chain amino acid transport system ATP-binding protein
LIKQFRGFIAVRNVNLKIERGTVHALIGPNGAGKTTVFNLLTKYLSPSQGQIFYKGEDITAHQPAEIAVRGIARSFQISAIFAELTVRENVCMALQRKLGISYQFWRSDSVLNQLNTRADEVLSLVGLAPEADMRSAELSYGKKRSLEIATTLALEPELLLLDEPMAGLAIEDIPRITDLIKTVAKSRTVVMVEHNLSVVAELSDIITVMKLGEIIAEGTYATISNDSEVMAAYLGVQR